MITRHVVIGGMKHCGKSTQGKRLAEFWQVPFFDTDTLLEEAYCRVTGKKRTCREIFREEGENFFRQREAEVIAHLAASEPPEGRVIALGGGVPANQFIPEDHLQKLGFFVFLELDEKAAFERVARGGLPPYCGDYGRGCRVRFAINLRNCKFFCKKTIDNQNFDAII